MKYIIDKNKRPAYAQLYKQLRNDVIAGLFPYNSKLPSKRLLAAETGVSTITVEHAYALLCDEGYAESRQRSGYFVIFRQNDGFARSAAEEPPRPVHAPSALPDFPVSVLSRTMRRVLIDYRNILLEKAPNTGCLELRGAISRYLLRNRGLSVDPAQIVVGSGAEYLYRLIVDLLGRERIYAIESPSYDKIESIYRASGVTYEALPLSGDGIDSTALAAARASVLHTTPYQSVPTGVTASATKRHEYIRWAAQRDRLIIESDYGSEFSVSTQPMETLFMLSACDNVIYLNTFSKTISPSLRVGYMVLPRHLVDSFQEKLGFYSCSVPTFEQFVLAELIESGDFERHINRVRRFKRRELLGKTEHPKSPADKSEPQS